MFDFLNGWKSIIGASLAVVAGFLQGFDVVGPEVLNPVWGLSIGFFGVGIAGKGQKIADALAQQIKAK